MENKYLIINAEGKVFEPDVFLKLKECPDEFKVVIEREALKIRNESDQNINQSDKPKYLEYAHKLGFRWEPAADIGFIQYDYKADLIMRLVKEYARQLIQGLDLNLYEVKGSNFFDLQYPVVQAYAGLFGDRLFKHKYGKNEMVMSYDASYPQFNIASRSIISNDAMPFAHFSISDCYRYEQRGECMLLYRNRRFFMPDIHPYFRDIEEAFEWYFKFEDKILESVKMANRQYWNVAKVSSEASWEKYKDRIAAIALRKGAPMLVEIRRDDEERYWIVDIDYSIVDSFKQVREIACIQIDVGNAQRLGIKYRDADGVEKHPVIIHSAIPGGIERFIYMLLDNFKESFPFWLYPVQVRILPVSEKHNEAAVVFVEKIKNSLKQKHGLDLRIEIDDRSESISKKIKECHKDLVPEQFVFGDKEMENSLELEKGLLELAKQNIGFPFIDAGWPGALSRQIKQP